jgi:hypothetical protein
LAVGGGLAVAASPKATAKAKASKLTCKFTLTTTPSADTNTVAQPETQGSQYGPVRCARAGFGAGLVADAFKVPDTGDTAGKYVQYFRGGSIKGKFDIVPQEGAPVSSSTFSSLTWQGPITITGGTGAYKAIKERKRTGVLTCTSNDSVHFSCTEKIKVILAG